VKTTKSMTEKLQSKLNETAQELIANNVSTIAQLLQESPDGKLSLSLSVGMTLAGNRVYVEGGISFAKKFKDDFSGMIEIEDPNQPELGGVTMTIQTGDKSATITSEQAGNAVKILKKAAKKLRAAGTN
jgi:hypothetical protein